MKLLVIVAVGVVRKSRKFSGHPYVLGAVRDHLCDSTDFLYALAFIFCIKLFTYRPPYLVLQKFILINYMSTVQFTAEQLQPLRTCHCGTNSGTV